MRPPLIISSPNALIRFRCSASGISLRKISSTSITAYPFSTKYWAAVVFPLPAGPVIAITLAPNLALLAIISSSSTAGGAVGGAVGNFTSGAPPKDSTNSRQWSSVLLRVIAALSNSFLKVLNDHLDGFSLSGSSSPIHISSPSLLAGRGKIGLSHNVDSSTSATLVKILSSLSNKHPWPDNFSTSVTLTSFPSLVVKVPTFASALPSTRKSLAPIKLLFWLDSTLTTTSSSFLILII